MNEEPNEKSEGFVPFDPSNLPLEDVSTDPNLDPSPERKRMREAFGARVLVVTNIYLQSPNEETVPCDIRYFRSVSTEEQHYGPRRVTIGEKWEKLDLGWVSKPSLVVIRNLEGTHLQVIPTDNEKRLIGGKVIEVGLAPSEGSKTPRDMFSPAREEPIAFAEILPGEAAPFTPPTGDASRYVLRSRNGRAKVTILAFPRTIEPPWLKDRETSNG